MNMGIVSMPACHLPKLVLFAAIPLAAFMYLFAFLFRTLSLVMSRGASGGGDRLGILEQALTDDEAGEIIYGASFSREAEAILYDASSCMEAMQASIPSVSYGSCPDGNDDTSQRCAVCFSKVRNEDEVRRLPHCRHLFHTRCIDAWLLCSHRTCPLCRASLLPSLKQAEEQHLVYPHESMLSWLASLQQDAEEANTV